LVKARTSIVRVKDTTKADIKMAANIIDWYHNRGVGDIKAAEDQLLEVEKAEERREAERKARLRTERLDKLASVDMDGTPFPLADMAEDDFLRLYETAAAARQGRIDAERRAEEERKAREAAEAAFVAQREERLARERAEAEAKLAAERKAREEAEAKAKAEREAHEAKLAEERKAHEARLAAERQAREAAEATARAEREAVEREAMLRAAAERKAREEAETARRKAEAAPDREKLLALANQLAATGLPQMSTHAGYQALKQAHAQLGDLVASIRNSAERLAL
jgi:hypothetical protein